MGRERDRKSDRKINLLGGTPQHQNLDPRQGSFKPKRKSNVTYNDLHTHGLIVLTIHRT